MTLEPFTFAFYRYLVWAAVLLCIVRSMGSANVIMRPDQWCIFGLGILIILFHRTAYLLGQSLTTASHGALMFAATPFWICLLAVLVWTYYTVLGWPLVRRYGALRVTPYALAAGSLSYAPFGAYRTMMGDEPLHRMAAPDGCLDPFSSVYPPGIVMPWRCEPAPSPWMNRNPLWLAIVLPPQSITHAAGSPERDRTRIALPRESMSRLPSPWKTPSVWTTMVSAAAETILASSRQAA